jgi:hypothetical protein
MVLKDAPEGVQAIFRDLMRDMEMDRQKKELATIKDDRASHKMTRLMGPNGGSYVIVIRTSGADGRTVDFCRSCWKNAAGWFLSWRESEREDGAWERTDWQAHKTRKHAGHMAEVKANTFDDSRLA